MAKRIRANTEESDKLHKAVGRAIEWHRQNEIRLIQEVQATAEHDEHADSFDIYADPYCRECRIDFPEQLGLADIEVPDIEFDDYGNEVVVRERINENSNSDS